MSRFHLMRSLALTVLSAFTLSVFPAAVAAQETFTYTGPILDTTASAPQLFAGPPLQASDGNFYTAWSDASGGRIERIDLGGNVTVVYAFGTTGPNSPVGNLIQGADGYLYGQLEVDPVNNYGDFYKIALDGTNFAVLYPFSYPSDGGLAYGGLTLGADGNFYGIGSAYINYAGVAPFHGRSAAAIRSRRQAAKKSFPQSSSSHTPGWHSRALTTPTKTSVRRGPHSDDLAAGACSSSPTDTFYQLSPTGTANVMYCSYGDDPLDGVLGPVVQAFDGDFFALTSLSVNGSGEIVVLDTAGDEFVAGPAPGESEYSLTNLVGGVDGNFYTSINGEDCGAILQIQPFNNYFTQYSELDCTDAALPVGTLSMGTDGTLFGAGYYDTVNGGGAVFQLDLEYGYIDFPYEFNGTSGAQPNSAPTQGRDGNFYGATSNTNTDADDNLPTYYRLGVSPGLPPPVTVTAPVHTVTADTPVTFTISVNNASPLTPPVCVALKNNATGPNGWSGIVTPPVIDYGLAFQSVTFTPDASGPLSDYELVCQGSGSAITTYLTPPPLTSSLSLSLSPSSPIVTGTPVSLAATVTAFTNGCNAASSGQTPRQECSVPIHPFSLGVHPQIPYPTPSGTVTFTTGDYKIGQANLVSGTATLPVATLYLAAGTYTVTATYSGDVNFAPVSTSQPVTVTGLSTTVSFSIQNETSPDASLTAGDTAQLLAEVVSSTGAAPGAVGSVSFYLGKTALCAGTVTANGSASCSVSTANLPAGNFPVYAAYAGDTYHAASQSAAQTVALLKAATTTALTVSPASVVQGQPEQLTATVSSATTTPTGQVNFTVFGNLVCSGTVTAGSATCGVTVPLRAILATYPVVATYTGDADSASSSSAAVDVTVQPHP